MGTDAALMMAVATMALLLTMVGIKHIMRRILRHKHGPDFAQNRFEAGRLVIVSCTAVFMLGAVLMLGQQTIAPHMMASAHAPTSGTLVALAD